MKTFSCRAEYPRDVHAFENELRVKNIQYEIYTEKLLIATPPEPTWYGDLKVEFRANMTLRDVRLMLHNIVDTHYMIESLRECPLAENSLDRDALPSYDPATF